MVDNLMPLHLSFDRPTSSFVLWKSLLLSARASAFTLAFVSKDINRLITTILYRTAIYFRTGSFYRALQAISFTVGEYIRNLFLGDDMLGPGLGTKILTRCPYVEHLVLNVEEGLWIAVDAS